MCFLLCTGFSLSAWLNCRSIEVHVSFFFPSRSHCAQSHMAAPSNPCNTLEVTVSLIFGQDQSFSFIFYLAHPRPVVSMVLYFFFRALLTVYTDHKNHHEAMTNHSSEPLMWPCLYTH